MHDILKWDSSTNSQASLAVHVCMFKICVNFTKKKHLTKLVTLNINCNNVYFSNLRANTSFGCLIFFLKWWVTGGLEWHCVGASLIFVLLLSHVFQTVPFLQDDWHRKLLCMHCGGRWHHESCSSATGKERNLWLLHTILQVEQTQNIKDNPKTLVKALQALPQKTTSVMQAPRQENSWEDQRWVQKPWHGHIFLTLSSHRHIFLTWCSHFLPEIPASSAHLQCHCIPPPPVVLSSGFLRIWKVTIQFIDICENVCTAFCWCLSCVYTNDIVSEPHWDFVADWRCWT